MNLRKKYDEEWKPKLIYPKNEGMIPEGEMIEYKYRET